MVANKFQILNKLIIKRFIFHLVDNYYCERLYSSLNTSRYAEIEFFVGNTKKFLRFFLSFRLDYKYNFYRLVSLSPYGFYSFLFVGSISNIRRPWRRNLSLQKPFKKQNWLVIYFLFKKFSVSFQYFLFFSQNSISLSDSELNEDKGKIRRFLIHLFQAYLFEIYYFRTRTIGNRKKSDLISLNYLSSNFNKIIFFC